MNFARIRFDTILSWVVIIVLTLTPLLFLPVVQSFYDTAKWSMITIGASILLVLWGAQLLITGEFRVPTAARSFGFLALLGSSLVSFLFVSDNKWEALTNPSGFPMFFAIAIIVILGLGSMNKKQEKYLRWGLFTTSGILSLIAVYMYFGLGKLMFPTLAFLSDPLWTPMGSSIAMLSYLFFTVPLLIGEFVRAKREKAEIELSLTTTLGLLTIAACVLTLINLIPQIPSLILPLPVSWTVALESLKKPIAALFGVGAENFLSAFTAARPPGMNLSPLWNARFTVSGSLALHLITIYGITGALACIMLIRSVFTVGDWKSRWADKLAAFVTLFAALLTPFHIGILTLVGTTVLLDLDESRQLTVKLPRKLGAVRVAIFALTLILGITSVYGIGRYLYGERIFYRSVVAAAQNNGVLTYNLQMKTILVNPTNVQYHIAYSNTNLALALGLAQQLSTTSADKRETDTKTVSQLIQQAIREAKLATDLAPKNVLAWETLGGVYQRITGIIEGADNWAIASYQRAIQLDPTNPVLRMSLAGSFMRIRNLDAARDQLTTSMLLKPDAPTIHYNLAYIYRLKGEFFNEAVSLKQTLALLPADSDDAAKATRELETAKSKLTKEELTAYMKLDGQQEELDETKTISPLGPSGPEISPKLEIPRESTVSAR